MSRSNLIRQHSPKEGVDIMFRTILVGLPRCRLVGLLVVCILLTSSALFSIGDAKASSSTSSYSLPTWWAKYQRLLTGSSSSPSSQSQAFSVGSNVDVSNEDTPQSETSITVNPNTPTMLVGGSNEIVRLPMRGYFSSDGGKTWGAVDLPLPPPATTNGVDFGSDPGVAFDTRGNVYYSYIVVFFNRFFDSIQGTEMAVAKSSDGGRTWPQVTFFRRRHSGDGEPARLALPGVRCRPECWEQPRHALLFLDGRDGVERNGYLRVPLNRSRRKLEYANACQR